MACLPFNISSAGCAITNYTISVSRFWDNSTNKTVKPALCYTSGEKLPFGLRSVRACANPVMGRYLRIAEFNAQEAALCICELEVYGSTTGMFDWSHIISYIVIKWLLCSGWNLRYGILGKLST